MNDLWKRRMAMLVVLPMAATAQTTIQTNTAAPAQGGTLVIAGQAEQAPVVRLNGKAYVDIESLARITHGSVRFNGSQTILTLPAAGGATSTVASQPTKTPQFSGGFLSAEIEALTQVREWRAALVNAIQNNYPVAESWVGGIRRTANGKLDLALAAAVTEPDQKAAELLRNEFANMQQMSDQFVARHAQANYIAPDSFDDNALDQKILSCEHALISIAARKQFQDEPSCH